MLRLTLQHNFPILSEAVIEHISGRDQSALGFAATEANRSELDFQLAQIGHRRIGRIERSIRKGTSDQARPGDRCQQQRSDCGPGTHDACSN